MAAVASPPPSSMAPPPMPRGRGLIARLTHDPNAIWMREMRQSARLGRTPWILFGLSLTISLLMCSIGGLAASDNTSPASLGGGLFQTFFSIAYFVVMIVGPAVAANSVASEREGRTWEAILLTGLHPKDIARGKFMAAYTSIAMHIVVLAPVGALPFLFGGVTPVEVIVAFAFLFVFAALAVAFGLAVSSLMSSLRGALVITLILAICIGPTLYSVVGFGGSFAVHKLWDDVPEGFPVWLPLAYTRAPFGIEYMLVLVAVPLLLLLVPAWFLYEITVANLTGETDDRSTGLKRWFAVSTPLLAMACALPSAVATTDDNRSSLAIAGLTLFATYAAFCALLFAFDPAGPSRRVFTHWRRSDAGLMRRFFGPGLAKTATLVMLLGFLGLAGITGVDAAAMYFAPTSVAPAYAYGATLPSRMDHIGQILVFGAYSAPFFVFTTGLVMYFRARGSSPWVSRLIAGAVLFLVAAGPWVVAAIGGVVSSSHDEAWLVVGSPSPFYAYVMASWMAKTSADQVPIIQTGLACALLWGLIGLLLVAAAARRCSLLIREQNAQLAQTEAALRAEDEAVIGSAQEAAAPPPEDPAGPDGPTPEASGAT